MVAQIDVSTEGQRQQGQTTLLLDVALANAQRGAFVVFWSQGARLNKAAANEAYELVAGDQRVHRVHRALGRESVEYAGGGRVLFVWGEYDPYRYGRADVHVVDYDEGGHVLREPAWTMRAAANRKALRCG